MLRLTVCWATGTPAPPSVVHGGLQPAPEAQQPGGAALVPECTENVFWKDPSLCS